METSKFTHDALLKTNNQNLNKPEWKETNIIDATQVLEYKSLKKTTKTYGRNTN